MRSVAGGRPAIRPVVEEVLDGAEGITAETRASIAARVGKRLSPCVMRIKRKLLRVSLPKRSLPGRVGSRLATADVVPLTHIGVRPLIGNAIRLVEGAV